MIGIWGRVAGVEGTPKRRVAHRCLLNAGLMGTV